jgi:hypothetical protein
MTLESVRIVKAEDLPAETLAKHNLPSEGFIEVRIERNSDPSPTFHALDAKKTDELRHKLEQKSLLF